MALKQTPKKVSLPKPQSFQGFTPSPGDDALVKKFVVHARHNQQGFTSKFKDGRIANVKAGPSNRYAVAGNTLIVYNPRSRQYTVYGVPKEGGTYGGWYDRETGRYLIEESSLYSDKHVALYHARRRKQKAIFDLVKLKEIELHYKRRSKITGMRIRTVSKKKMGPYIALHGKLPKNELPKRFRKIAKKDVLIRAGLPKKERKRVLRHEKIEVGLMDKGMRYKQAHRKTVETMRKPRAPCVKKGRRWFNRLSGKFISSERVSRINSYFKSHPDGSLYQAIGGPVYREGVPWLEQSMRLQRIYEKREVQVVKTKDKFGNDIYFNPITGKRVRGNQVKKALSMDFQRGMFTVHLYRLTATRKIVYHLISTKIEQVLKVDEDVNGVFRALKLQWLPQVMRLIREIVETYPLGKSTTMYIRFEHDLIITNQGQKDAGAVVIMEQRMPGYSEHLNLLPSELERARKEYIRLLHQYRLIMLHRVRIYISDFANEENMAIASNRIGVMSHIKRD